MTPLKIIQVTTFFSPVVGGVETQVEDLARELCDLGHSVEIIATDSGRSGKKVDVNVAQRQLQFESGVVSITRVHTWFSMSEFHKFAPGLISELWRRDFDVVHVHGVRKLEVYIALLVAKLKRKKVVVSTHNPFTTVNRGLANRIFILLHDLTFGLFFMRFVDHYLLLMSSERPILARFGVRYQQMTVVGNAVNRDFFAPSRVGRAEFLGLVSEYVDPTRRAAILNKNWQAVVLGVGRLNIMKGFQNLQLASEKLPNVLFVIAGGDDGYAAELSKCFSGQENVLLLGRNIARQDLLDFYSNADIFVLPSLHEPFGIVLLEAMAQGCAIVATDSGGPKDILYEAGIEYGALVPPDDPESLFTSISSIAQNPEQLAAYRKFAGQRAEIYTWEKILPKYLTVYGE